GSGSLNLNNHNLLVDSGSTPFSTIRSYVISGHGSAWTGPGINSSAVAANASTLALAYANGTDGAVASSGAVAGKTLVRPSLIGDANLDGFADNADISQVL